MGSADSETEPRRRPYRVYREGSEPDPRFTLANERTFLAWLRTALALMAGGVGIEALNAAQGETGPLRTLLAVVLLVGGILCSMTAFVRWAVTERALRTGSALPAPRLAPVLGYGLAVIGIFACILVLVAGV
ncbi:putative membrane protein [Halopolyspora algeriensis]|uniref:Putative membrane protein n=1 Tax=Halopolyspora algeriensis TaxID=1500506 RepID=A0A368VVS4_9ACTN|nr:DUF202 domain-containing protein [Halopolyspora algeriensis]RCW45303.1 putative membrane protein [Halopolyspora algeriensis]TQM47343.1 putative membrane protein [Halopolyspora algeriensis]